MAIVKVIITEQEINGIGMRHTPVNKPGLYLAEHGWQITAITVSDIPESELPVKANEAYDIRAKQLGY